MSHKGWQSSLRKKRVLQCFTILLALGLIVLASCGALNGFNSGNEAKSPTAEATVVPPVEVTGSYLATILMDESSKPIAQAEVSADSGRFSKRTDEKGVFALPVSLIKDNAAELDVKINGQITFVRVHMPTDIRDAVRNLDPAAKIEIGRKLGFRLTKDQIPSANSPTNRIPVATWSLPQEVLQAAAVNNSVTPFAVTSHKNEDVVKDLVTLAGTCNVGSQIKLTGDLFQTVDSVCLASGNPGTFNVTVKLSQPDGLKFVTVTQTDPITGLYISQLLLLINNINSPNASTLIVKKILPDWPNVIECRGTGVNSIYRQYFYLSGQIGNTKVRFTSPINHRSTGAGAYALLFNMDKTYNGTNGGSTGSMADCIGKSIADLEQMGRLHPAEIGKNIYPDWPDVIECSGAAEKEFFYLSNFSADSAPTYVDPYTHNGSGAGAYGLLFNSDKSSNGTLGGAQASMSDCVGKSMTELQNMGRGKSLFTGQGIFGDWPIAIECRGVGANAGAKQVFYLSHSRNSGSSIVFVDPYTHAGSGAGAYGIIFSSNKNFENTLGGATASMEDCLGKSITELGNLGRLHF